MLALIRRSLDIAVIAVSPAPQRKQEAAPATTQPSSAAPAAQPVNVPKDAPAATQDIPATDLQEVEGAFIEEIPHQEVCGESNLLSIALICVSFTVSMSGWKRYSGRTVSSHHPQPQTRASGHRGTDWEVHWLLLCCQVVRHVRWVHAEACGMVERLQGHASKERRI
jgi:hypothetical protein